MFPALALRFVPVVAEKFDRVRRPLRSVATAQIVGRAEFIAAPADALRVLRMEWNFRHMLGVHVSCHYQRAWVVRFRNTGGWGIVGKLGVAAPVPSLAIR